MCYESQGIVHTTAKVAAYYTKVLLLKLTDVVAGHVLKQKAGRFEMEACVSTHTYRVGDEYRSAHKKSILSFSRGSQVSWDIW